MVRHLTRDFINLLLLVARQQLINFCGVGKFQQGIILVLTTLSLKVDWVDFLVS